jgi:hypothetical protein
MALSPNYGWTEPDNTGLVKNGAQDMRTLGDAIDASVWNIGFGQAGKNKIINGDFGIWQRGTSLTYTTSGLNYLADRFFSWTIGTLNITVSRQAFTPGTAPVAGYESQYFLRNAVTSLSGQSIQAVGQRIEDARTFAGQTATFSFYAKADASRTYTARVIQNFGSGGSTEVATSLGSYSVTTSWQRFSVTVAVPSVSGKTIGTSSFLMLLLDGPSNTANTLDTWGWQLERGSKATPFQTASGGSPQAELAMCQRYCFKVTNDGNDKAIASGGYYASTVFIGTLNFPTMRTAPTGTIVNGTNYWAIYANSAVDFADTASLSSFTNNCCNIEIGGNVLGVNGFAGQLRTQNTLASIILSAEL